MDPWIRDVHGSNNFKLISREKAEAMPTGSRGRTQRRRSGITRSGTEWNGMPRSGTEDVKRAAPSYTGSFIEKSGMERRFKAFEPEGLGFAERNFKRFKPERTEEPAEREV